MPFIFVPVDKKPDNLSRLLKQEVSFMLNDPKSLLSATLALGGGSPEGVIQITKHVLSPNELKR